MFDISRYIGEFTMEQMELSSGYVIAYPNFEWIANFIFLMLITYFIVKSIFAIVRLFI